MKDKLVNKSINEIKIKHNKNYNGTKYNDINIKEVNKNTNSNKINKNKINDKKLNNITNNEESTEENSHIKTEYGNNNDIIKNYSQHSLNRINTTSSKSFRKYIYKNNNILDSFKNSDHSMNNEVNSINEKFINKNISKNKNYKNETNTNIKNNNNESINNINIKNNSNSNSSYDNYGSKKKVSSYKKGKNLEKNHYNISIPITKTYSNSNSSLKKNKKVIKKQQNLIKKLKSTAEKMQPTDKKIKNEIKNLYDKKINPDENSKLDNNKNNSNNNNNNNNINVNSNNYSDNNTNNNNNSYSNNNTNTNSNNNTKTNSNINTNTNTNTNTNINTDSDTNINNNNNINSTNNNDNNINCSNNNDSDSNDNNNVNNIKTNSNDNNNDNHNTSTNNNSNNNINNNNNIINNININNTNNIKDNNSSKDINRIMELGNVIHENSLNKLKPNLKSRSKDDIDIIKNKRNTNNHSASSYYSTTTTSSSRSTLSSYSKTLNKTQLEIHQRFKKMKQEKINANNKNTNIAITNSNNDNSNIDNTNNNNINLNQKNDKNKSKCDKKSGVINLTVSTLTGQQFPIKVLNTYTIGDIKDLIQDKEGISSQTQILIYQDRTLDCDSMTLEDYGIEDGSSIKLLIKLFDGLCNIEQSDTKRDNTIVLLLCKKKGYLYLFETSLKSSNQLSNESFDSSFFDFCNSVGDNKSISSSELSSKSSTPLSSTYSNSSLYNKESLNFINSQTSKSTLDSVNDDSSGKKKLSLSNSNRSISINYDILKIIENATLCANKSGYNVTVAIQDLDSPSYSYQSSINSFSDDDSSNEIYQTRNYKTASSYNSDNRNNSKLSTNSSINLNSNTNSHINSKQTTSMSLDTPFEYLYNNSNETNFCFPFLGCNLYPLYKCKDSILRRTKSDIFNIKQLDNKKNSLTIRKQKSDSQLFDKNFLEYYNKTCQTRFFDPHNTNDNSSISNSNSIIYPYYFLIRNFDNIINPYNYNNNNNNNNNNNIEIYSSSNGNTIKDIDDRSHKSKTNTKKNHNHKLLNFISNSSFSTSPNTSNSKSHKNNNNKFNNITISQSNNTNKNKITVNEKLLSKSYSQIFNQQYMGNKMTGRNTVDGNPLNSRLENKLYSKRPSSSIPVVTKISNNFTSINNKNKNNNNNNNNNNNKNNYNDSNKNNNNIINIKNFNNNNNNSNSKLNSNTNTNSIKSSFNIYEDIIPKKYLLSKNKSDITPPHIIRSSFNIYEDINPNNLVKSPEKSKNDSKHLNKLKNKTQNKNMVSLPDISIKNNYYERKPKKFTPSETTYSFPDIYQYKSIPNDKIYKPQITIQYKESPTEDDIDRYITEDNQNYNVNKIKRHAKINKLEPQIYHKKRPSTYIRYDSKEMLDDTNTIMKKIESEYSINDYSDEEDNIALSYYYQNPEINSIKENSIKGISFDKYSFITDQEGSKSFHKEYIDYSNDNFDDEYVLFHEEKDIPINKLKSFISTRSLKNEISIDKNLDLSLKKKIDSNYSNENKPQLPSESELLKNEINTMNKLQDKSDEEPKKDKKNICEFCNKKLRITATYKCKCGKIFCASHRYSECHNCTYDYKKQGKKDLEKNNPLVVKDKIQKF